MRTAAILFEPEGYQPTAGRPLGRQVAGQGLLRAAVEGADGGSMVGYGAPNHEAAWREAVRLLGSQADPQWIVLDQAERFVAHRVCFRPDPQLTADARLRLRVGPGAYSLCGQVHTISSDLPQIASLLTEPLADWDALICPSEAVAEGVRQVFAAQTDFLRWKFGAAAPMAAPRLPVIPLGVHTADFTFSAEERAAARAALGLAQDEVVALYAGRRSIFTKAHPVPMYLGLEAAAKQTGAKVVLIECGYASPSGMATAMDAAPAIHCPSVRSVMTDGRVPETLRRCWAAADLFISLSDNMQETFGLTPLEAMAAGLPAVVTDWNGYRETVRDGVDGFRIATWAPQAGVGEHLARSREMGTLPIDLAHYAAASFTSLDLTQLGERLAALISNPQLRVRMGAAGRARAAEVYEWRTVFRAYQDLWDELDARRQAGPVPAAPRSTGGGVDFFAAFAHYPTTAIGPDTVAILAPGVTPAAYEAMAKSPLFPLSPAPERLVAALWPMLAAGPVTAGAAATALGWPLHLAIQTLGALAKMGLVRLSKPDGP